MDDFNQAIDRYQAARREFVKGHHEPVKEMFSQQEDVVLFNPLRPVAHGPSEVAATLQEAASHFAEGELEFHVIEKHSIDGFGYVVEIEPFRAKVDGKEGSGSLRVTSILRKEGGTWKVALRHADPITVPQSTDSILRK
jgi:ketosteroid isomerase-like protein